MMKVTIFPGDKVDVTVQLGYVRTDITRADGNRFVIYGDGIKLVNG